MEQTRCDNNPRENCRIIYAKYLQYRSTPFFMCRVSSWEFLSVVAINKLCLSFISPKNCSAINLLKLTKYFMRCFSLSLLLVQCVSDIPSPRYISQNHQLSHLDSKYQFPFCFNFSKTTYLLACSFHDILSNLLYNYISVASITFSSLIWSYSTHCDTAI